MNRDRLLGGAVILLIVISAVAAVSLPGVFAESTERERPGRVDISEITIAPGPVSGGSATLAVTTYLRHRGGHSDNITLRVLAIDIDSGMIETDRRMSVEPIRGDREVNVTTNISVTRQGGYRVETLLYIDGERRQTTAKRVEGVGTLTPAYAVTPIEFHRFGGTRRSDLPAVQYAIERAGGNRSTLAVSAYLTNQGDEPSGDLRIQFIVRQADSNIIAARESVAVGTIQPGRTATPGTSVTVPANYNYYLDAVLWKDGVIVGTARSVANLNPTERISANTTVREVGLDVSDFEGEAGPTSEKAAARTARVEATPAPGQPGFTPIVVLAALATIAIIAWRRQHD